MLNLRSFISTLALLLFVAAPVGVLLAPADAYAAQVLQAKNKKVLLDISDMDDLRPGDEVFATDESGKKKGLLKIRQVKNGRATADVTKGAADVGYGLVPKAHAISRPVDEGDLQGNGNQSAGDASYYRSLRRQNSSAQGDLGLMGAMNMISLNAAFKVGTGGTARNSSVSLKGTSFGVNGFYDYTLMSRFQIRGMAGYEMMQGTGQTLNADCGGGTTTSCMFSANYISLYGQLKYNLVDGKYRAWIAGGFGYYIAMSKSSNVLSESGLASNQIYGASAGLDIPIGRTHKYYVPVEVDYGLFPASDTVTGANIIFARAGLGWNL